MFQQVVNHHTQQLANHLISELSNITMCQSSKCAAVNWRGCMNINVTNPWLCSDLGLLAPLRAFGCVVSSRVSRVLWTVLFQPLHSPQKVPVSARTAHGFLSLIHTVCRTCWHVNKCGPWVTKGSGRPGSDPHGVLVQNHQAYWYKTTRCTGSVLVQTKLVYWFRITWCTGSEPPGVLVRAFFTMYLNLNVCGLPAGFLEQVAQLFFCTLITFLYIYLNNIHNNYSMKVWFGSNHFPK